MQATRVEPGKQCPAAFRMACSSSDPMRMSLKQQLDKREDKCQKNTQYVSKSELLCMYVSRRMPWNHRNAFVASTSIDPWVAACGEYDGWNEKSASSFLTLHALAVVGLSVSLQRKKISVTYYIVQMTWNGHYVFFLQLQTLNNRSWPVQR